MVALIERRGSVVDAIDLFCGAGGTSQGIVAGGATLRVAANHSQKAIDCHAANWPGVDHRRADLSDPDSADYVDPASLPAARLLVASPSCTFHSIANAKKIYARGPQLSFLDDEEEFDEVAYANSERSRVTMLCPLRYAARHRPEIVIVENVVEAAKWGPGRDGSTFSWWLSEWTKLGYDYECCFLNSQFFPPCPQSRDRLYIVIWRKGNTAPDLDYHPTAYCTSQRCGGRLVGAVQTWKQRTAAWPLEHWGKYREQYVYTCPDCRAVVEPAAWPAYSAINWGNLGPSIAERSRPLAPATMERIRRGLQKFRGTPPVVIPTKATWGTDRSVCDPFVTQTSQQDKALVSDGLVIPLRTNGVASNAYETIKTVVAGNIGHAVVGRPFVVKNNGSIDEAGYRSAPVTDPLGTIMASPTAMSLVSDGVVVPVAGNTFEHPGCVRARRLSDPLFTQHATRAFGFAHLPMIPVLRGESSCWSIADACATVEASGSHLGLATPAIFAKFNGVPGDTSWRGDGEPLNTITGRDTTGLVVMPWIDQYMSDPVAVTEQLATVMSHLRQALATASHPSEPITDEDVMSVRFRMLEPDPELRRAMAFAEDYILLGSKTDVTSLLGNAVTPPVATWITGQALATLDARKAG